MPTLTFTFSSDLPKDDPVTLWRLQQHLLAQAESRFGPKDIHKAIYQPVFRNDGPIIINTPAFDGAFAALSLNASGYWPTALYELAHETVHLLNPIAGLTNWLEEGIAVAFSVEMSRLFTIHAMMPDETSSYFKALEMVDSLPMPYCNVARQVRTECGALCACSLESLTRMCPGADVELLTKLTERCQPR